MSRRFTKDLSRELIKFVKSVEISLNLQQAETTGAYEFARQMSSPHFKKINPHYDFNFKSHNNNDEAIVKAVLADGSKWEKVVSSMKANEIRSDFFSEVENISDNMELEGNDDSDDGGDDSAPGKKGGAPAKGAGGKGGGGAKK